MSVLWIQRVQGVGCHGLTHQATNHQVRSERETEG